ncbi:MAG: DEAD/DEAH box helicase [Gammaproteobacteria bacterium]|nr:DEAD/DEAH box helicase [Gammaproteobacteria bacterium]
MQLDRLFHPAVKGWFEKTFSAPTEPQANAWPRICAGKNTLIAAPTGSGKTLAAFLAAIDELVRMGEQGPLPDETRVVYISPLKALSNDVERNLKAPLSGIRDRLLESGQPDVDIRAQVRTGDTPQSERERMRRRPPHILVTTPESFYILLTSESGRRMLATTRSVIVDEIHALAPNKRGSHLSLSLERLEELAGRSLTRIGLSATQRPIEVIADFLTGGRDCEIVDSGHRREWDLALQLPGSPLEAVMPGEVWTELYDRIAALAETERTTLVFVNTRRLAERAARHLAERLGESAVTSHHGSLSREHRLAAEQALKEGRLKCLVATASLELGIDIGDVDLVCQLGSPRSIAAFLQRVGRSGHQLTGIPKGRLFPTTRDELVECAALLDACRRGELDRMVIPAQPLDVLAQQIVAEVAGREYGEDALLALIRRAMPYRDLDAEKYGAVLEMLAEGYSTRRGRRSAYLHRDRINARLRARRGARLTAMTCGGTIPEQADYDVVLEPQGHLVGSLNEDFAIESLPGDIFQLGNSSWRILRIEAGKVRVEDARGQPPNMPFWVGEAPGRSDELSLAVARLRDFAGGKLESDSDPAALAGALAGEYVLETSAARQIADYLAASHAMLGVLPGTRHIVFERFFDETGDMHFVVHSPLGSRVNRAWGLALRKRFCRRFNFELQAAATEDAVVLSLGPTHSFPLDEPSRYLNPDTVREVLVQALLAAPLFTARWRWNATNALAIRRFRNGRKNPPQFQRMDAEDLVAVVFPDQIACAENLAGDREIPDHPLVEQTLSDCLHVAMDLDGLRRLLVDLRDGGRILVTRDLPEPSPLSQEILNARPYAFLDDAPLEERRTQAVASRRFLDPRTAADLGRLDPAAIAGVREEAWPQARDADEVHEALVLAGFIRVTEADAQPGWPAWLDFLAAEGRATRLVEPSLWCAAERLAQLQALFPHGDFRPQLSLPQSLRSKIAADAALVEMVRSRLEISGPVTAAALAGPLAMTAAQLQPALGALESEGFVLRGCFSASEEEWCERRLLARINRYTLKRLRREIEPVSAANYVRFLLRWQGVSPESERRQGPEGLMAALGQLEGFDAPAAAWEAEILPARVDGYDPAWLDQLCLSGRVLWARFSPPSGDAGGPVRATPIAFCTRAVAGVWQQVRGEGRGEPRGSNARQLHALLGERGACFFEDLVSASGLLRSQVEEALGELVASGLVNADAFAGLRGLLTGRGAGGRGGRGRRRRELNLGAAGRWSLVGTAGQAMEPVEHVARCLLNRYGVVFRRAVEREARGLPPWRELLWCLRRLETRGEIRGGRFVEGFSGEQFALPEALEMLRTVRRTPASAEMVSLAAADPLNLSGGVLPGERIAPRRDNRLLLRGGEIVASQRGEGVEFGAGLDAEARFEARQALMRRRIPPPLRSYLGRA